MTIVIPTLFKSNRIYQTLIELSMCEFVSEIILIDNTSNKKQIKLDKLKHICEGHNTYVNPAWNKGVSLAKSDKICILNDDIWMNWDYLKNISDLITEDVGLLGMSEENFSDNCKSNYQVSTLPATYKSSKGHRPIGYCCCFFIHKNNYSNIPDEIKIWAGDDWLFYKKDGKPNLLIEGIRIGGELSSTSTDSRFDEIKINDILQIKKYIEMGILDNFLIHTIWDK